MRTCETQVRAQALSTRPIVDILSVVSSRHGAIDKMMRALYLAEGEGLIVLSSHVAAGEGVAFTLPRDMAALRHPRDRSPFRCTHSFASDPSRDGSLSLARHSQMSPVDRTPVCRGAQRDQPIAYPIRMTALVYGSEGGERCRGHCAAPLTPELCDTDFRKVSCHGSLVPHAASSRVTGMFAGSGTTA